MASGGFIDVVGDFEDDGTFFPVVRFIPRDVDEFEPRPVVYVGGDVGVEAVVARSERAAIVVRAIVARPDGFSFQLVAHSLERLDMYVGPWGPDPNDAVRAGLVYPDGAKVLSDHEWNPEGDEPAHGLVPGGGSGDGWSYETVYRAWPLPGPGTLTFVVRWRAMGIEDARYELDASRLAEAAGRAEPLWD